MIRVRGVLSALVTGPLDGLAWSQSDRVASTLETILDRAGIGVAATDLRERAITILLDLHLQRNHRASGAKVYSVLDDVGAFHAELHSMLFRLRGYLDYGPIDPSEPAADAIRQRALRFMAAVVTSTIAASSEVEERHSGQAFDAWPPEDQELARSLAHLADTITTELYFASGAYEEKRPEKESNRPPKGTKEVARFLVECGPFIDQLAMFHYPAILHRLLETLEFLVPADPERVFLQVGRVVHAGRQSGYQYEGPAADLMVRFVERYLAQYRHIFRENSECLKSLIAILDTFVQVGWPSARRLVYRMEELFR